MGRHESREAKSLPRKSRSGRRKRRGVMGARPDSGAEAGAGDRAGRTCEQLESQVQGAGKQPFEKFHHECNRTALL